MSLDKYCLRSIPLKCGHRVHLEKSYLSTDTCLECSTPLTPEDYDKFCFVCFWPLLEWNQYTLDQSCNHAFHRLCLAPFLLNPDNAKCPRCNLPITSYNKTDLFHERLRLHYNVSNLNTSTTCAQILTLPETIIDDKFIPENNSEDVQYNLTFHPPEEWWNGLDEGLTFSDYNLNLAAYCIKKFLVTGKQPSHLKWFEIQIPIDMHKIFCDIMSEDGNSSFVLPFWSWCLGKGGHHRHMILVTSHIYRIWETEISRYLKEINDPWKLLDALGCVSQKDSGCVPYKNTDSRNYIINRTLPDSFKWILACTWKRGLYYLVQREAEKLSLREKFSCVRTRSGDLFHLFPQDLPNVPLDLILPVSKKFVPTNKPTPFALYIDYDVTLLTKKLYFEIDQDVLSLTDTEWGKLQWKLGNVFSHFLNYRLPLNIVGKECEVFREFESDKRRIENLQGQVKKMRTENPEG